jgi:hypothetical protein
LASAGDTSKNHQRERKMAGKQQKNRKRKKINFEVTKPEMDDSRKRKQAENLIFFS